MSQIRPFPGASVKRIIREKDYLMLPISKREAFILPRRSFENQKRFEDAFRYASAQISAGSAGAGDRHQ
ncbi:YcxB family protein (plasmid) [Rhizobium acidisoli]|uniref:YcxB family protein n=1 Tax=Rhizobium acidisoli TaxID=1538158 RepID=A0AAE6C4R7_9HYPH|nr:YcxB family protein [Rhizobium acidisoli]